ncbi:MAG: DUF3899 domain-containing protein [Eubacteriales bacterium]|nr:DUF3899 domain-containing protein [Eubacteriales bacterium]
MEKKGRKWFWRIVRVVLEMAAAAAIARLRGFDFANPLALNARYLSDGCFVVGFILTGLGALIWISTTGFFDMMAYGVQSLLVLFSILKSPKDHPSFYDYKQMRNAKRNKPRFGMLITGIIFILASLACLAIYYRG